jgi:hypothetical protein
VSPDGPSLPLHPGLRARFRSAGAKIEWTPTVTGPDRPAERRRQQVRLHEDEAHIEEWGTESVGGMMVDSAPLGALVLMLALDRRGVPTAWGATHAGRDPAFPEGAIVAIWGPGEAPADEQPRFEDVVDLARYALE